MKNEYGDLVRADNAVNDQLVWCDRSRKSGCSQFCKFKVVVIKNHTLTNLNKIVVFWNILYALVSETKYRFLWNRFGTGSKKNVNIPIPICYTVVYVYFIQSNTDTNKCTLRNLTTLRLKKSQTTWEVWLTYYIEIRKLYLNLQLISSENLEKYLRF